MAPSFSWGSARPVNPLLPIDAYGTLAYPLSARPVGYGRNTLYGEATHSLDARLTKTIKIMNERAKWVFGVEGFNLLNHTNYARIGAYWTGPGFTRTVEIAAARQIQFFGGLEF